MKMNPSVEDFLQKMNRGGEAEYRRKLEIFHMYLKESFEIPDNNYKSYFKIIDSLTESDIEESVKFYINRKGRKNVGYCSPVRVFRSAVLEYLRFLFKENKYPVGNPLYDSDLRQKELQDSIEALMKQLGLKESESDKHLSPEECIELIDKCNKYIEFSLETLINDDAYNKDYTKFLSAIINKLILLYGASRDTINSLTLNCVDYELGCITINGYTVRMPNDLIIQMRKYLHVREAIVTEKDKDRLFVRRYAQSAKRSNQASELDSATICVVLNEITGTNSVASLSKTAIISMIRNGASQRLITNFTGNKKDIYEYCLDIAYEDSIADDNRRLDVIFRSSDLFDNL